MNFSSFCLIFQSFFNIIIINLIVWGNDKVPNAFFQYIFEQLYNKVPTKLNKQS